ncbi:hypothetical protein J1N35_000463 [Gossypium stocksii]|uniref:Uncharacterized protein n=1 Tax=Gossypium stocksii TaxID=47602 RepID=A0A9D3WH96_9ROSI|nr:hypothetical protein J1N35_000463 [Gossypium stocksii]
MGKDLNLHIQELYKREWRALIKQVSRKVSFAVDNLANLMKGSSIITRIFHVVPPSIDDQMRSDRCFRLSDFDPTVSL